MRILFAFTGGRGHADPLVPIAHAAEDAGHTVAFTGRPALVPAVEALGFSVFVTGPDARNTPPRRIPLRELDAEREDRDLRDGFAVRNARERAADMLVLCGEWRPDLVVCDEVDFGSMLAAERLGLPYASVLVIAAGSFVRHELVADALTGLRAEQGLPPDPELEMLNRYLVLSPFPPGYRDPAFPLPATAHCFRPLTLDSAQSDALPSWPVRLPGAPTVYFTLGTVFNLESGDLFERVLAGLGRLPVNVVGDGWNADRPRGARTACPGTCTSRGSSTSPWCCRTAAPSSRTAARAACSARWRTACRWSCCPWAPISP